MSTPDAIRTLRAIDWDFATPRSGYVAPPHWYPGTFIPALSDTLIEALTPAGGKVFDPYAGIGTTGWSAIRAGRSCELADINPVAVLSSYITTSLLALAREDPGLARLALASLARLIGRNDDLFGASASGDTDPRLDEAVAALNGHGPADVLAWVRADGVNARALAPWLAPQTLGEVVSMTDTIATASSAFLRLMGLCMVSAVMRSVSSQHASWGHIADNVRPRELVVQNLHAASTRWMKRTMAFVTQPATPPPTVDGEKPGITVRITDWSKPAVAGGDDVAGDSDLLLTSPPYADAIDYTLSQRLSLYLLGHSDEAIQALVAGEIGARRKRFKKATSRQTWSSELTTALERQVARLKPNGIVCLVLPHKDSGRSLGEDDLKATLSRLGWSLFFERDRSIHQSHTRQSWTSIKKETIIAFDRGNA